MPKALRPRVLDELSFRERYKIFSKLYEIFKVKGVTLKKFESGIPRDIAKVLQETYNIEEYAYDTMLSIINYFREARNQGNIVGIYPKSITSGLHNPDGITENRSMFNAKFLPHLWRLAKQNIHYIGVNRNDPRLLQYYISKGYEDRDVDILTEGRTSRPGKFFTKYTNLPADVIQGIAEAWDKAFVPPKLEVDFVVETTPEGVKHAYHEANYSSRYSGDSLGSSCMRYDTLQHAVGHYARIGAGVLVAYEKDTTRVLARAVYWPGVKDSRGAEFTFVDRIYHVGNYKLIDMFLAYCHEQGWKTKHEHGSSYTWRFTGPEPEESSCPYHDTFIGYDRNLGAYITEEPQEDGYVLTYTDGRCELVDPPEPMVEDAHGNEILQSEAVYIHELDEYYLYADTVYSQHANTRIPEDRAIQVEGRWFWDDDDDIIEDEANEGQFIHRVYAYRLEDGRYTSWENVGHCPWTRQSIVLTEAHYSETYRMHFLNEEAEREYHSNVLQYHFPITNTFTTTGVTNEV